MVNMSAKINNLSEKQMHFNKKIVGQTQKVAVSFSFFDFFLYICATRMKNTMHQFSFLLVVIPTK
jgi:hypothetical protein